MGPENAQRMLGPEGWIPNAEEALEVGIVQEVVPHDQVFNNKNISLVYIFSFYSEKNLRFEILRKNFVKLFFLISRIFCLFVLFV